MFNTEEEYIMKLGLDFYNTYEKSQKRLLEKIKIHKLDNKFFELSKSSRGKKLHKISKNPIDAYYTYKANQELENNEKKILLNSILLNVDSAVLFLENEDKISNDKMERIVYTLSRDIDILYNNICYLEGDHYNLAISFIIKDYEYAKNY